MTTPTFATINIGTSANDGTGDTLRAAAQKINDNFAACVHRYTQIVDVTANYTIQASDAGKLLRVNSAGTVTITLPDSFDAGFGVPVLRRGAGAVQFATTGGASMNNEFSHTQIARQHGWAQVFVEANATGTAAAWNMSGSTAP